MFNKKLNQKTVIQALAGVSHPVSRKSIADLNLVQGLKVEGGKVSFVLEVAPAEKDLATVIQKKCQDVLKSLKGVEAVNIVITAERPGPELEGAKKASRTAPEKVPVPGVGAVIAVASGKGGVGKSTIAANLALGLKHLGLAVGFLDADVYGPSAPMMFGLSGRPELRDDKITPVEKFGLKIISMGLMVDTEAPLIWRGPMVGKAVQQFLYEVDWEGLDVLVVDMPPGTGDAQLTLAQMVPLSGVVIVSTPQDLALIDARKGLEMFRTINVPILGIIENMSTFICPHCGEQSHIFSHGGVFETAERLGVPFLGEIPLNMALREASDSGTPLMAASPDSPEAKAFLKIAEKVHQNI
jgi:ATP-binding protein involved in chromosome partitioning